MTKPARIDWTHALDAQLRSLYPHMRTADVATAMGLPKGAVQGRADRQGVRKTPAFRSQYVQETARARSRWNGALEEVFALMYPHYRTYDLVELLGMPAQALTSKAQDMGLRKTKATRTKLQQDACRQRMQTCPESFTFQKGLIPWNKGKSFPSPPGTVRTQFKPGHVSSTMLPVGTVRMRVMSGMADTAMQKTAQPSVWRPVHALVWEQATGKPYPKGRVMTFKDGNRQNLSPDNLHLVTRTEFALRTSPMFNGTLPPEMLYLHRLRGALTRTLQHATRRVQQQHRAIP